MRMNLELAKLKIEAEEFLEDLLKLSSIYGEINGILNSYVKGKASKATTGQNILQAWENAPDTIPIKCAFKLSQPNHCGFAKNRVFVLWNDHMENFSIVTFTVSEEDPTFFCVGDYEVFCKLI